VGTRWYITTAARLHAAGVTTEMKCPALDCARMISGVERREAQEPGGLGGWRAVCVCGAIADIFDNDDDEGDGG